MKERLKGLVTGIIIGVMIAATSVMASNGTIQKILNYNNIKITMNGQEVKPTDANGNYVEPFIIDGTTYLPVRGVANALGLHVQWDGDTKTVKLSETPFVEDEKTEAVGKTEVEEFADTYGNWIAEGIKTSYEAESGLKCTCIVEGKGNELIIKLCMNEIDGIPDSLKAEMQKEIDVTEEDLKESLESFSELVPSLEKATMIFCEKDGDPLIAISADFK